MKKYSIAVALLLGSGSLAQAATFNGKTTAMSDAGVATSNYLEGINLNPAALANFRERDDFGFNINAGAQAADENDLLDNAEGLADALDRLQGQVPEAQDVEYVLGQLRAIDGNWARLSAGASAFVNIPGQRFSLALSGRSYMDAGVSAEVDPGDIDMLQQAAENNIPFDPDTLDSSVAAMGAVVSEFGLTLASTATLSGHAVSWGITPKYQRVDSLDYRARVDDFDEDDVDSDDYLTDDAAFNLDLGVQAHFGSWHAGATLSNAIEQEYRSIAGRELTLEPRLTLGGGYRNDWFTAALDVDANATPNLITQEESRFARAGLEFNGWGWVQLRLGYQSDLESVLEDTVSAGIGFSPLGVVNIDISVMAGEDDNVGGAVQFGLAF